MVGHPRVKAAAPRGTTGCESDGGRCVTRPSFLAWATAPGGLYLHDRRTPTLAGWGDYHAAILDHLFPGGDADAPLPYSRIVWSTPKKSAKSTLAAGLHLWFAQFVGVPTEQYALANDLEGARSRVWRYIAASLERNPLAEAKADWRISGNTIALANGSTIRAIASDYRGEAGSNFTLATVDEPWGIVYEGGMRLMTEFSPVPTRPHSTVFYTGYAGFEGQSAFWHGLIDTALAGEPVPALRGLENGDGAPACWRNGRLFAYVDHAARMPWHTPEYLAEQRRILPPGEYLRVWENRRIHSADAFCTPERWESLYDPGLRALHPGDERPLVLAADAATRSDCTALVGCTWNPTAGRVEVIYASIWQPGGGEPLRLTETLGPEIARLHREYRVVEVLYDPYQMAAISELCRRAGVPMTEFPQTGQRVQADTHLHQLIWGGNLAHTGDPILRQHVLGAMAQASERGLRITKALAAGKVDGAVALSMAAFGAVERLAGARAGRIRPARNPFYAR